jgi:hypothetical protein
MGLKLALGTRGAASAWRIIQTEVVASGCVMVTVKSLSAFGILPAMDLTKVPEEFKQPISQAVCHRTRLAELLVQSLAVATGKGRRVMLRGHPAALVFKRE